MEAFYAVELLAKVGLQKSKIDFWDTPIWLVCDPSSFMCNGRLLAEAAFSDIHALAWQPSLSSYHPLG